MNPFPSGSTMATLKEFFVRDGSSNLTTQREFTVAQSGGETVGAAIARLHLDFEANAKFVSFYIPPIAVEFPEPLLLNELDGILAWTKTDLEVQAGFAGEIKDANDLVFTGQVYLYSERQVPHQLKARLTNEGSRKGLHLTFRSTEYATRRSAFERPRAFICHDSRDKSTVAEPLAIELQKRSCPVWYDDFSLKVGDSLREGIELGLQQCEKCILVLTPNFLENSGWSRREYDSIFTRELVERQNVILPIWNNVDREKVFKYSPILADRVAAKWELGIEEVTRRILKAIGP
jgi:hypothetical protein